MPDGSLCLLDYGMVGMLEDPRREQLIDLFLAVVRQDVHGAVNTILAIGQPRGSIDAPDHVAPPSVPGNHTPGVVSIGEYAPPLQRNRAKRSAQ